MNVVLEIIILALYYRYTDNAIADYWPADYQWCTEN